MPRGATEGNSRDVRTTRLASEGGDEWVDGPWVRKWGYVDRCDASKVPLSTSHGVWAASTSAPRSRRVLGRSRVPRPVCTRDSFTF